MFSSKNQLQILKFQCIGKTQGLWEKNSSILRKNSSFSASKLNEPVVTNYTRYHKSVEKKPGLVYLHQIDGLHHVTDQEEIFEAAQLVHVNL